MPQEKFDEILRNILEEESVEDLLDIPGVYEVVANYYTEEIERTYEEELANMSPRELFELSREDEV